MLVRDKGVGGSLSPPIPDTELVVCPVLIGVAQGFQNWHFVVGLKGPVRFIDTPPKKLRQNLGKELRVFEGNLALSVG